MSKPSQSKYKHIFQNPNIKRKKSNAKYKKAMNTFVRIIKKMKKEWDTKVLVNEKTRAVARFKKMWISDNQVTKVLERRELKDLVAKSYRD